MKCFPSQLFKLLLISFLSSHSSLIQAGEIRTLALSDGWPIPGMVQNDQGLTAFSAGFTGLGGDALRIATRDGLVKIAAIGDPVPGLTAARFTSLGARVGAGDYLGSFALNQRGDAAFTASFDASSRFQGLFLYDAAGRTRSIALAGDTAPGMGGKTFQYFDQLWINSSGTIVFSAFTSAGPRFTEQWWHTGGLYIYSGNGIEKIIADAEPLPSGRLMDFASDILSLFLNDEDSVALLTRSGPNIFSSSPLYRWKAGAWSRLAGPGDRIAEGQNAYVLQSIFGAVFNCCGDVAFRAFYSQPGTTGYTQGLFLKSREKDIVRILSDGEITPAGGRYWLTGYQGGLFGFGRPYGFTMSPRLNNQGDLLFVVPIKGAPAGAALLLYSKGSLQKVVADGDPLPAGTEGTYAFASLFEVSLNDFIPVTSTAFSMNDSGTIVFSTPIKGSLNKSGMFAIIGGTVSKIVFSGEFVSSAQPYAFVMDPSRANPQLNNADELVFYSDLAGGTAKLGIFSTSLARLEGGLNGDFEGGREDSLPAFWSTVWSNSGTGNAFQWNAGERASFHGNGVLRLQAGPGGGSAFVLSNPIPVEGNTVYRVSSQMRFNLESSSDAVFFSLIELDSRGNAVAFRELKGARGDNFWLWKPFQFRFTTRAEAAFLRIRFGLIAAGESFLDVDDVR